MARWEPESDLRLSDRTFPPCQLFGELALRLGELALRLGEFSKRDRRLQVALSELSLITDPIAERSQTDRESGEQTKTERTE